MAASKAVQAGYGKKHYEANKEKMKARAVEHKAQITAYINELKSKPCTDCGVCYPPYVMDFDHVIGEKFKGISKMVAHNNSLELIKEEIAKCELVCANCHRERTFSRMRDKQAIAEAAA